MYFPLRSSLQLVYYAAPGPGKQVPKAFQYPPASAPGHQRTAPPSPRTRLTSASTYRNASWPPTRDKKMLDGIAAKAAATAGKGIPESENGPEAVAARRERLVRILLEPYAQGSRGFVQEAYILTHPYGFHLKDVQNKVQIWHGTKDANSPIRMVQYMKERLPDCELNELEGETHFTIQKHLEDVVVKLVKKQ